ncbi:MAP7 domain-containing protein 2 isoform X10 [Syngnathoides biaculeatus]|uniref:MAP7 domain-containing protein 2 isoform X10 n=1 Tax=Syngnathoides biaculeatus TaxID=300417 RepID=UPI002ADE15BC|nr:MAP7 domain-containing protein 2 isoform X10 [Syngnathoides biaculeatus]
MAEAAVTLKGLRTQMAAAAQAQGEERRSQAASPALPANTAAKLQGCRPVLDGATLRVDDRLRVAKERREEADRQQALRESQIMERERKAKMQVERQLEERQKKAVEQRRKEEQKRLAVEEKRKQKQEEEKEHYEAVMRRTLERSQRADQRQKRWSWGGLSADSDGRTGDSDAGASSPVAKVISPAVPEKPPRNQQDKRSTSTVNLKQPSESSISKRLSSSSATLIKSPDKSASMKKRSSSLTRVSVGRAQTPAKAAKGTADNQECHLCPRSASAAILHPPRGPLRSRSIDRQKNGMTTSVSADGALDPSLAKQEKTFTSPGRQRPPSPSIPMGRNRSPSPAPKPSPKRPPSPAASKQNSKARPSSPAMKQHPPSPQPTSAKPPPIQKPALTPPGPPTLRKRDSRPKDLLLPGQTGSPQSSDSSKSKEKDEFKTGTNSAAEAAKLLAEHRRQMREQKEKDEQLRIQREEEERLRKEEEDRQAEEARLKREEEEKKLAEERKIKEAEEAQRAEEERERLEAEEALKQAELQKEREEAEAKALEEAERVRQERDRIMQQNQQERMERKKRIEEIMKRTRKGDGNDFKRDDDKDQEDNEDGMDPMSFDAKCESEMGDVAMERHNCGDDVAQREEPLGCPNGREETDDKENNNAPDETQAVSPVSKGRLVEGSEFLNEQDSANVELVSGVGGKSNQWSFEELMDRNVHSKTHPLIEADDCNPVLINLDGPDGTKGSPVNSLHSSSQAIEALSEI